MESERPRERLAQYGPNALSNAELLGILLRVGMPGENAVQIGSRLLQTFGGLKGIHKASFDEVCEEHGIGPAKAAQIKAAVELGRRLSQISDDARPSIHSPRDAADLVKYEMSVLEQEDLRVILLDTRNYVVEIVDLYRGTMNSSQVRVGEIFRDAVRKNAASIIVVHNHPSGDPSPSPEDVTVTKAICEAGELLDIDVLDHLIIGGNEFVSMKERGLGF